ncbi:MAG: hypothetical protein QOD29_547 [Alphaproteobacteria bacterium]|jgi:hypothetical protein|nr:hypothetical protein [Alphaproteobacteria bacterium]
MLTPMFTPTLCVIAQAAAIKHLGKAAWRVRLGVGCVVVNYQSVTVTSHTYEYC